MAENGVKVTTMDGEEGVLLVGKDVGKTVVQLLTLVEGREPFVVDMDPEQAERLTERLALTTGQITRPTD